MSTIDDIWKVETDLSAGPAGLASWDTGGGSSIDANVASIAFCMASEGWEGCGSPAGFVGGAATGSKPTAALSKTL